MKKQVAVVMVAIMVVSVLMAMPVMSGSGNSDEMEMAMTSQNPELVPDNSSIVQDTVNATIPGYTIVVYNETYKENAVINKSTTGQIPTISTSSVTILDHTMCKAVDKDNNPIDRTTKFYTTDPEAILWYKATNIYPGDTFRSEWYYPNGSIYINPPAYKYPEWRSPCLPPDCAMKKACHMFISDRPPANNPGRWHVTLYCNGVRKFTEYFTISPPPEKPDLIITDIWQSGDTIYYKIKNQGNAAADSSTTYLYIDGSYKASDPVSSISVGGTRTESFTDYKWECSEKTDTIKVCADAAKKVDESNETNNCKSVTWACPGKPDLIIANIWHSGNTIHYTVENQGDVAAGSSTTYLYIDGSYKASDPVSSIPVGWKTESFADYEWRCSGKSDTIKVCADATKKVDESDETNNCKSVIWTCLPDIWVNLTKFEKTLPQNIIWNGTMTIGNSGNDVLNFEISYSGKQTTIPLQSGWPVTTGGSVLSSPALGDIDGDGDMEIVVGSGDDKVYAWHHDGTLVTGWPKTTGGSVWSSPALGDIDGDGDIEVVVEVYAWHHNGTLVKGWPKTTGSLVVSSPALGDIDGDGDIEIVAGSGDGKVYVWHHNGTLVKGWPKATGGSVYSSPALGDINGDGDLEIVVGSWDDKVYAWHHDGTLVTGWPKTTGGGVWSSPALGDINGDGDIEIVVGSLDEKVYAWHHDGTLVTGWPKTTDFLVYSSPALGDIDGDGDLEIVVGSKDDRVYAWHHDGTLVKGWPKTTGNDVDSSPALGDIDGDGDIEIVVGSGDGKVYVWHHNGTLVKGWPKTTGSAVGKSSPALGDIDRDGDIEVVVGSFDHKVYAWDCSGTYDPSNIEWGMFHHDVGHTGVYTPTVSILHVSVYNISEVQDIINRAGATELFNVTQINLKDFNDGNPSDLSAFDVIVFGVSDCYEADGNAPLLIKRTSDLRKYVREGGGIVWTHDSLEHGEDWGPDIEEPAGVDECGAAWIGNKTQNIKIVRDHPVLHKPFEIGTVGKRIAKSHVLGGRSDYYNNPYAHTTGGKVTTAKIIIQHDTTSSTNNFYLTTHEYGNGRVIVCEIGHAVIDCDGKHYQIPSVKESQIFANALYWVSSAIPPKEEGWLSVTPTSGTVNPGSQTKISVTINTTGLAIGEYNANITITSNDPDESVVIVPVHLKLVQKL